MTTDPTEALAILRTFTEAYRKCPEGPWFAAEDEASDAPAHEKSGLALVDTGRQSDWPIARLCEWNTARLIAMIPQVIATIEAMQAEIARLRDKAQHFDYVKTLMREQHERDETERAALRERTTPRPIESAPPDEPCQIYNRETKIWRNVAGGYKFGRPGDTYWLPLPPPPWGET